MLSKQSCNCDGAPSGRVVIVVMVGFVVLLRGVVQETGAMTDDLTGPGRGEKLSWKHAGLSVEID